MPADGNLGFLRTNAHLAVVILSEEDDYSTMPVADAAADLLAAKGGDPTLLAVHALIPVVCWDAPRYGALAALTGGAVEDMCPGDWERIVADLGAKVGQRIPGRTWSGLAAPPIDVDGDGAITDADMRLFVDGAALPSDGGTRWIWDADLEAIVFAPGHAPAAGAAVSLERGCAP